MPKPPPVGPPLLPPALDAVPAAVSVAPPEPECPAPAPPPAPFPLLQATLANTASARTAALFSTLNRERRSKSKKAAYVERKRTTKVATVQYFPITTDS